MIEPSDADQPEQPEPNQSSLPDTGSDKEDGGATETHTAPDEIIIEPGERGTSHSLADATADEAADNQATSGTSVQEQPLAEQGEALVIQGGQPLGTTGQANRTADEEDENGETDGDDKPSDEEGPADSGRQRQIAEDTRATYDQAGFEEKWEQQQREEARNEEKEARESEFNRPRIRLTPLSDGDLATVRTLYVAPESYEVFCNEVFITTIGGRKSVSGNADKRVWLVAGSSGSGRVMSATRLALELLEAEGEHAESVLLYESKDYDLLEIAAGENLPAKSVIIFNDVFKRGRMSPHALFSPLGKVEGELKRRQVWLIFTVQEASQEFLLQDLEGRYPIFKAEQPNLTDVYVRLVEYHFSSDEYADENKRLLDLLERVPDALQPPRRAAHIEYWFRKHRNQVAELEACILNAKYEAATAVRDWFEGLPNLNYKLYGLLVVLFDGLDETWLDQIYESSVIHLRDTGMIQAEQFVDPRQLGREALESHLRLQRRGDQLSYEEERYWAEVKRQILNYQRLLWTLVGEFQAVVEGMNENYLITRRQQSRLQRRVKGNIEKNTPLRRRLNATNQRMDDIRHLRDVIAAAIAKIGGFHLRRLRGILDELAHNKDAFVVLTASMILAELAVEGEQSDFVMDVLHDWAQSQDFDLMWAASVSVSRVYERVVRRTGQALSEDVAPTNRVAEQRRALLEQLGELLAEVANSYSQYDHDLWNKRCRQIEEDILSLSSLRESLTQQIQAAVEAGALPDSFLTTYQAAPPEAQVQQALSVLPTERAAIARFIERECEKQHESWCDQIRLSVVSTVAYIASIHPADMASLVQSWLDNHTKDEAVMEVSYMALNRLFQQTNHLEAGLLERRAFPLLRLLKSLLQSKRPSLTGLIEQLRGLLHDESVSNEQQEAHREVVELLNKDPLRTALGAILQWYHTSVALAKALEEDSEESDTPLDDEEVSPGQGADQALAHARAALWESKVYPELLKAINLATPEQRQRFRDMLVAVWLVEEHEESAMVRRIARALLARSHIMDGTVVDLPQRERFGLFITDGAGDEAERTKLFNLVQHLTGLTPLHIMRLGHASFQRIEGVPTASEEQPPLLATDLVSRGHRRPPLLMPLLSPTMGAAAPPLEAARVHFIAVRTSTPIPDLPDFFDTLPAPPPESVRPKNIFHRTPAPSAPEGGSAGWEWDQKLFLLSPQPTSLPSSMRERLIPISDLNLPLLLLLQRQIPKTLHQISPAEMWRDLEQYIQTLPPRNLEALQAKLKEWLPLLNDIQHTHPRDDVALTIAWTLLVFSRERCDEAVSAIEGLLRDEDADDAALPNHQMGMACARMLFNFYAADPEHLSVTTHEALLKLLPAFNRAARDYTDLIPVWSVLLRWAQSKDWLATLLAPAGTEAEEEEPGHLMDSVDQLKAPDARAMQKWLERYNRLPDFVALFLAVGKPIKAFRETLLEAIAYREAKKQGRKQPQGKWVKQHPLPLPEPHLQSLLSFVPDDLTSTNPELEQLFWYLNQVGELAWESRSLKEREEYEERVRNMQTLAQRLRERLGRRLTGKLPAFTKKETCYGVVLVQGNHKQLTAKAVEVAYRFAMLRREARLFHEVVLTVHRLGSQELVRHIRKQAKRNDKELLDATARFSLMGPALDRYTNEEVGFILVLSDSPVLDFDDWAETEGWAERMWIMRPASSKWQPSQGEQVGLDEKIEMVLEQIAGRITRRKVPHVKP